MNKGVLLVISGPAGTGKGTVVNILMQKYGDCRLSVSATTRSPRPGEVEGVNYFYMTREEFAQKLEQGQFLESNFFSGNYYGTPKQAVLDATQNGENIILEIDTNGAMNIKKVMPEAVLVFIAPPSFEVLEARLRGRGTEKEEDILTRLNEAKRELGLQDKYDYVVVNRDNAAEQAADQVHEILVSELEKLNK